MCWWQSQASGNKRPQCNWGSIWDLLYKAFWWNKTARIKEGNQSPHRFSDSLQLGAWGNLISFIIKYQISLPYWQSAALTELPAEKLSQKYRGLFLSLLSPHVTLCFGCDFEYQFLVFLPVPFLIETLSNKNDKQKKKRTYKYIYCGNVGKDCGAGRDYPACSVGLCVLCVHRLGGR